MDERKRTLDASSGDHVESAESITGHPKRLRPGKLLDMYSILSMKLVLISLVLIYPARNAIACIPCPCHDEEDLLTQSEKRKPSEGQHRKLPIQQKQPQQQTQRHRTQQPQIEQQPQHQQQLRNSESAQQYAISISTHLCGNLPLTRLLVNKNQFSRLIGKSGKLCTALCLGCR